MENAKKHGTNRENDFFSIVEFGTLVSGCPNDENAFSIHVTPRSNGIHEFLNTKVNVLTARFLSLASEMKALVSTYLPMENKDADNKEDDNRFFYEKDGRVIEISVSAEQYEALFSQPMKKASEENSQTHKPKKSPLDSLPDLSHIPRRDPSEVVPPDEQIAVSVTPDENLASETLADLHLVQGNKKEAIRIYKKLSLLFPEKRAYFEALIKKIQKK